jgi:D-alanyl-D-alanine carboxypeptidase
VRAPRCRALLAAFLSATTCAAQDRARLAELVAELTRPPFGTGASLTLSIGDEASTLTAGTLWVDGPAVTERSRFNVASVSKLLTASKVVALAAEGRLGLDDSVSAWLSGVRLVDRSGDDRAVTLRQLLMHRGGLPHQPGALDPGDWSAPALLTTLTDDWSITLVGEPGAYAYSNVGYALLGAIVERVEGASFADAMGAHLRGLGMEASTFWPAALEDAAHGVAGDAVRAPEWYGSRYALPFTGLWCTTPDLARFGRALLVAAGDPSAPLHAMTVGTGHGLGPVVRLRDGKRSLEHDGAGPGFMAWLIVVPERELVLAVACNGGQETREQARRLFELTEAMLAAAR